ncbi:hypothetical protein [uncultured Nostoc sp.]|uniref:hypothetical protein n=1 Tax=uncultured Nostoc sp. TaxID=340711 RepID=UPI0035C9EFB7
MTNNTSAFFDLLRLRPTRRRGFALSVAMPQALRLRWLTSSVQVAQGKSQFDCAHRKLSTSDK